MMSYLYRFSLSALAVLLLVLTAPAALAQETVPAPDNRPSPMVAAQLLTDQGYAKVMYGSPRMRDRVIFGELVPYGEVWRTGANEATELTTTTDLKMGDEVLPAGTYTVYTIPETDQWTVIFSRMVGQWGSYNYDDSMDALRITVPSMQMDESHEAFTIAFEDADGGTQMAMMWEQTKVAVPVEFAGSM
ncbi:MAG: DUF2911 domain-containing protein [Bacteroidota bacterium]